jgi:type IV pilus assembly protein PilC
MMEKVADFYEEEVATALESLSSMIEPLLMVFLGVVIGGIVICMFLPVFKMHEIVGS